MRLIVTVDNTFIKQLPDAPGVYRFYAIDGTLLYIGKALSLLKRVKSYFQKKSELSPRISLMVSKITELEITITENETSALLLENNLIKSLKPKYNIIFRDDKTYPYIKISEHSFPLIEYYRGKTHKNASFYGPYPNGYAVRETLNLLQRLFKLRTCSDKVLANRSRPCMLYQINLCSAPCVNKISQEEYQQYIKFAKKFLAGEYGLLINQLTEQMYQASENYEYEQAAVIRDQISLIREMQDKQIISDSNEPINADILLYQEAHGFAFIYLIIIRNGLYIGDKHFSSRKNDTPEFIVEAFIENYYNETKQKFNLYLPFMLSDSFMDYFTQNYTIKLKTKLIGRINDLAAMGTLNLTKTVENFQINNIYYTGSCNLAELLQLKFIQRIECYDTSHNQGSSAVASMVVYSNDKIDNSQYRRFNLPDEINGDDLLALQHVLQRRLKNNDLELPQVILIDGGKNQLKIAKNVVKELGFHDKIKVIAVFKGENRNPEFDKIIINPTLTLSFRQEPHIFRLLQSLRDEAHRFAITGHRKKQEERMKVSRLEDIPGVGRQKRKALMAFFGSSKLVAEASVSELLQVSGIGAQLAQEIHEYFHG